jgi:hypothetical protein
MSDAWKKPTADSTLHKFLILSRQKAQSSALLIAIDQTTVQVIGCSHQQIKNDWRIVNTDQWFRPAMLAQASEPTSTSNNEVSPGLNTALDLNPKSEETAQVQKQTPP